MKDANESLKQTTIVLNKAVVVINVANANNIVSGICKAILDAQENTKCKVQIEQKNIEQTMEFSQATLKNVEIPMKLYLDTQLHDIDVHESHMSNATRKMKEFGLRTFERK